MGANIKIASESKQFIDEMKQVTDSLKLMDSELSVSIEKARLFGDEQDNLKAQHSQLSNALKSNTTLLDLQSKTMNALSSDIQKYSSRNDELSKSISELEKKLRDSIKATGDSSEETKTLRTELNKLQSEYTANDKAIDKATGQIDKYKIKMNNTEKAILGTKKQLEDVSKSLEHIPLENVSKGLDKISEKSGNVAKVLAKGIVAPMTALGGIAVKSALDSEKEMGKLQAKLGLTAEEADNLNNIARNVYSDGFGDSIEDSIDSLVLLQSNLSSTKNWTDETKESVLKQISTIKETFGAESNEIIKTIKVMQDSGLTDDVENSLDIITRGFQEGGDYSGELLDTIREYSPQFVKIGLSADEAMKYLITGAENGAFNLDKVGDSMKEFSIRAIDGSKSTQEGFTLIGLDAETMSNSIAKGGASAKEAFERTLEGLTSIKDPVKQNQAGVDLFGTMWEDLGSTTVLSLAGVKGGLENVTGATNKAAEALSANPQAQFQQKLRETQSALIPLGTKLLDLGVNIVPGLSSGLNTVTDILKNLSPETTANIVQFGLFAIGTTSVFEGISKVSSGISGAIDLFAMMKESTTLASAATKVMTLAQEGLNIALNLNPIGAVILLITGLVGGFILAYNKVDWFKDKVDSAFSNIKDTVTEVFNLVSSFEIPHIKLPHFNISGSFSLAPPSMPKLGVEWYADGAIMTQPTLFGFNGLNAMIGGEAGHEAILPLKQLWDQLDKNFEELEQRLSNHTFTVTIPVYLGDNEIAKVAKIMTPIISNQLSKSTIRRRG